MELAYSLLFLGEKDARSPLASLPLVGREAFLSD